MSKPKMNPDETDGAAVAAPACSLAQVGADGTTWTRGRGIGRTPAPGTDFRKTPSIHLATLSAPRSGRSAALILPPPSVQAATSGASIAII